MNDEFFNNNRINIHGYYYCTIEKQINKSKLSMTYYNNVQKKSFRGVLNFKLQMGKDMGVTLGVKNVRKISKKKSLSLGLDYRMKDNGLISLVIGGGKILGLKISL